MMQNILYKPQTFYRNDGFQFVEYIPRFWECKYAPPKQKIKLTTAQKIMAIECGIMLDSLIHWLSNSNFIF